MKRVLSVIFLLAALCSQAQFNESTVTVKLGAGYAQDFPGLGGYGIVGEVSMPMSDRLEGAIGMKRMNMQGYPRTASVKEFTSATSIDFNIYFLPLNTESSKIRMGAGYAFSFFKTRRSYPVTTGNGSEKLTTWPVQDQKGKSSGLSLIGEYEFTPEGSNISFGVRAAWYKAYDRVTYVGPFAAIRI